MANGKANVLSGDTDTGASLLSGALAYGLSSTADSVPRFVSRVKRSGGGGGVSVKGTVSSNIGSIAGGATGIPGGSVIGGVIGSVFGGSFGGFGGGGHHKVRLPDVQIPGTLAAYRSENLPIGINIPYTNFSASAYRRLGPKIAQQQAAITGGMYGLMADLESLGMVKEETRKVNLQFDTVNMHQASSPGNAVQRNQQGMNMLVSVIDTINQFKTDKKEKGTIGTRKRRVAASRNVFTDPLGIASNKLS